MDNFVRDVDLRRRFRIPIESLSVSGTARSGSTLTAVIAPSEATGTYQWYRDNTVILGATNSTYAQVDSDIGKIIKCVFTANGKYSGEANTSMTTTTVKDTWSKSFSGNSGCYTTYATTGYSLASNQVVTYAYCSATTPNHTSDNSETATVHAWLTVGSTTKEGSTGYASSGQTASSSVSWSGTAQGVSITFGNSASNGDSFWRYVNGNANGYYIHN